MTVIMKIPNDLAEKAQRKAAQEHLSLEEYVLELLQEALAEGTPAPTLEEVVAKIQATPSNPANLRPASGSLSDALRQAPQDPDFDLAIWEQAWESLESYR